jgi:hypothetical protein
MGNVEGKIYNDGFSGPQDVIDQFNAPDDALTGATVFYASYTYEDYSGYAVVVFEKDGKLWEVHGSHCSCHGLEGQWDLEETNWEAIAMRPEHELVEMAKVKLANSKPY